MSSYAITFEVAVALLRGDILRGGEVASGKAWGIIDTTLALGAFDARSDAWCSDRDGIPHRYTLEEAEARARRLTGSSHDGRTYCALEIPERARQAAAGRHCAALGSLQFECVDWSNGPARELAVGAAFDAAIAFVGFVGEREAHAALSRLEGEP